MKEHFACFYGTVHVIGGIYKETFLVIDPFSVFYTTGLFKGNILYKEYILNSTQVQQQQNG